MNDEKDEKEEKKLTFWVIIKIIIILNIIIQFGLFVKYRNNLISKLTKEKINKSDLITNENKEIENNNQENNIQENNIQKNNLHEKNLSDYNMVKFLAYDNFFFNSMSMYNIFKNKYFNITYLNYYFSHEYDKVRFEFNFGIYDKNKTLIQPSDFSLYNGMCVLCHMKVGKTNIYSLPQILENKYFNCIEFFEIGEKVKFGLHIFPQRRKNYFTISFDFHRFINLKDNSHENDTIFSPSFISKEFDKFDKRTRNKKLNMNYILTRNYMKKPVCDLKRNSLDKKKGWTFRNLYNNYFCFCVGKSCVKYEVKQTCKLNFYKNVIDNNRDLYPKTEYIFVDFIFKALPSDDTFPVFEEMMNKNMSAHYITEKETLYQEYCGDKKYCLTIIPMNIFTYYKFGDFVEKYLTLILKLKAVISCKQSSFHYLSYLFYKIEYVTYIAVGHGVDFFKDYLFENYRIYGSKINNKILIPPSKNLVDLAIKYGWSEKNIIKINLPRWDRYSQVDYYFSGNITNNSILVMFTWRYTKWWLGYRDISEIYHENIIKLLEDKKLHQTLQKYNMTLYFSLHRYVNRKYINKYDEAIRKVDNLKYVKQNELSECLAKTNLVVSDFSSIIFDLMSRGKPFVIYIPDAADKTITTYYTNDYIKLIKDMVSGKIEFRNKFFTLNETVDKVIYYIENKFKIEPELKEFYNSFHFKTKNNSNEFIDYLINLK